MPITPKQQVALIIFSTVLAAFSLGSLITFTDPYAASWVIHGFFYLSLFLLSLGIFTMIELGFRNWIGSQVFVAKLGHSFRQALLISVFVVLTFILQAHGLAFWWVEGSLMLFLLFAEAFLNLKA